MTDNYLEQYETPAEITIEQLRNALLDESSPLDARYLYRLSDLEGQDLRTIIDLWPEIPLWRRQALLEDLQVLAENDFVLSFEAVGRIAIDDLDPRVRFGGVQTLISSECEQPDLIPPLLSLAQEDEDPSVRAVAASALGRFVYMGELGSLTAQSRLTLEEQLLEVAENDHSDDVRRRALESLGYSGRPEVIKLIEASFNSGQAAEVASALFAMGRSADERWSEQVLAMLAHNHPAIRMEAVRAAGELGLAEARRTLLSLVTHDDIELRLTAIWALSQIGGDKVFQRLVNAMQRATDEEEISFIEMALDNLAFNEDVDGDLGMLYFTELDEDGDDTPDPWRATLDQEIDDEADEYEEADYRALEDFLDDDDNMDADEDRGD